MMLGQEVGRMAEHRTFYGFFSYAHHDAQTDPSLIEDFSSELEHRVNSKLTNARFAIWRDEGGLRTGEGWDEKIEAQIRRADVFILLLTPRWIHSNYCRKEYSIFEEVESLREVGEYVAPLLARSVAQQEKHFTLEQKDIYDRIARRQKFEAVNFFNRTRAQRISKIEKLADDIAGMIERLRDLPAMISHSPVTRTSARVERTAEFSARAEDYAEVDFLRSAEVRIEPIEKNRERSVYAQVGFVERLFVKGDKAYIGFGVRRATLSVASVAPGQLRQVPGFNVQDVDLAAYVSLKDMPEAVSVAMYASSGRALAELALPPTHNNYWSHIATATSETRSDQLQAELRVSLSPHGLHIPDARARPLSNTAKRKIEAIITVAMQKDERVAADGQICRSVPIRECKL
jgi:hypothetical protein